MQWGVLAPCSSGKVSAGEIPPCHVSLGQGLFLSDPVSAFPPCLSVVFTLCGGEQFI